MELQNLSTLLVKNIHFKQPLNQSYGGEMQMDFLESVKLCRERISVTEGGDGCCWSEYLTTR